MTDVEKSEISPRVEEFQIFHTTDVEKSEMLPKEPGPFKVPVKL